MDSVTFDGIVLTPIRRLFMPVPPGERSISRIDMQLTTAMGVGVDFQFNMGRLRDGAVQLVLPATQTVANEFKPTVFRTFLTTNVGVLYTEFVGDPRAVVFGAMDTVLNGDWALICSSEPLHELYATIASANAVASVMRIDQDVGGTWTNVTIVDGTIAAGATLAVAGAITWVGLGTEQRTTRTVTVAGGAVTLNGWWYRISVSAALTAATATTDLSGQRAVNDWYILDTPTGGSGRVIFRQGDYMSLHLPNAAAAGVATFRAWLGY